MQLEEIKYLIKRHSLENTPNETCGFIIENNGELELLICKNISLEPSNYFIISIEDTRMAHKKGCIKYIWHSHVDDSFSENDKFLAERTKIKLLLYVINADSFIEYVPCGYEVPYIGRPFLLGSLDCMHLVLDFYRKDLNIEIPWNDTTLQHLKLFDEWEKSPLNVPETVLFENVLLSKDFVRVNDLRKYDIILTRLPKLKCSCHVAIYLGDNKILHHVPGKLSGIEVYGKIWKRLTTGFFRHNKNI